MVPDRYAADSKQHGREKIHCEVQSDLERLMAVEYRKRRTMQTDEKEKMQSDKICLNRCIIRMNPI